MSHFVTSLPGASDFFSAGIVSYSVQAKISILRISAGTIQAHGVVSMETALEMAEKVCSVTGTDCSVSTTGNLGPGVLEEKEKGLVYIAASRQGTTICRTLELKGERSGNQH